jgi:NitT/TauT family transport system ATP-binding protein
VRNLSIMLPVEARDVRIEYRSSHQARPTVAVAKVDLTLADNELVCLVGPSGCGKTTFLNAVAGLVPISSGDLRVNGDRVVGPSRDRAMVFQHAALLPWRTALGNAEYGLEIQGHPRGQRRDAARRLLSLVGLEGYEEFYPHQLSGGMQQRVNLARALATEPRLLLMDEPFAALDALTREGMQAELMRIVGIANKPTLFVTHQIDESVFLAHRVIVFSDRPGTIRGEVAVNLPWPRSLDMKRSPEFRLYEAAVWDLLDLRQRNGTGHLGNDAS